MRSAAVKAGEQAARTGDNKMALKQCKEYRATKQRKERGYKNECLLKIEYAYFNDRCSMWKVLDDMTIHKTDSDNTLSADDFYKYFSELTQPSKAVYFSYDYENEAREFILKYDTGGNICTSPSALELLIINDVFAKDEIKFAIDSLKNNKAPGIDGIPAEIVKYCQEELTDIIVIVFNYMIENKDFPDIWAEGLRSVLFKSGSRLCVDNYRGITILGIFAKLFEIAVNNRLCFVNETFEKKMMFIMAASKKEVEPLIIYSS